MKKIGMFIMTFTIALFIGVLFVNATEEVKSSMTGVQISEDGIITFDEFEGADTYWLGVEQGSLPAVSGDSILPRIETVCTSGFEADLCGENYSGRYFIELGAYKEGNPISSRYYGWVDYDGTKYTLTEADGIYKIFVFDSNGGSGIDKMYVKDGNPIPRPDAPTKEGQTFLGWYRDKELTQKFAFDSFSNWYLRLYAKWGDPIEIDAVNFNNITVPVGGTHPDAELFRTITTSTEGLRIIMASWFEEGTGKELTSADTFETGKRYRLSIVVDFEDGYKFKDEADFWIEDHATLNVEPLMKDFIKERNEFQFPYDAIKKEESVDPTPTDPEPTEPVVVTPNLDGFKIKSASTTNVKIEWNKVDGAKGYFVYAGTSAKKLKKIATVKNTVTSYKQKKLKAGTTHYYKVVAYKVVKKKNKTIVSSTVLKTKTVPVAPKIKVKSTAFDRVKISVGKVTGASNYVIERSTDKKTYVVVNAFAKAGNYTDTEVVTGTKYYYRVSACNERCSAKSKVISAKPTLKAPSISVTSKTKAQVKITYKNVTGAEVYEIYRSTKKNGKYELVGSENALKYVDTTVKRKKTYYYKVRATIKVGEKVVGTYSKPKSVKVK